MKIDENVPKTIPSIIVNEKLRMLSPAKKKQIISTSNVAVPVLIVRASVWFSESLKSVHLSRLVYSPMFSRIRSNTTTLSLME